MAKKKKLPAEPAEFDSGELERWQHTFLLLKSLQTGERNPRPVRSDLPGLRSRVTLLAVLGNLVPRQASHRMLEVIGGWKQRLPRGSQIDFSMLRELTISILQAGVKPDHAKSDSVAKLADSLLESWQRQLLENPEWCYIPAVVPGESPTRIDDVFVELLAVPEDEVHVLTGNEDSSRTHRQRLSKDGPVVSVPTMTARTLEQCVIMGEPGSGKSTLVQWLARYVAQGNCTDFDTAILIRLSAFASKLGANPDLSLIGHFVQFADSEIAQPIDVACELREKARRSRRMLLLLDGWDEVPRKDRQAVLEKIRHEQSCFVIVITSRPTGLPRQLGGTALTDYYSVAGLSPRSRKELMQKHLQILGRPELFQSIERRIEREPDWREMTANPFLLGLLLRVLIRTEVNGAMPRTLNSVYAQIIAWTIEQYEQRNLSESPLTADHLRGLERLAHSLLCRRSRTKYLFQHCELVECLDGAGDAPILQSRLVHRTHPVYDEHGFLHATFQEYFAACFGGQLAPQEFDQLAAQAFFSSSRFIILEFAAGRSDWTALRLKELAQQWLAKPDRFGRVMFRVSRLVIAGRWANEGVGKSVREALWQEVISTDETTSAADAVHALAAIDAEALCHKVRETDNLAAWSRVSACESVTDFLLAKVPLDRLTQEQRPISPGFMTVDSVTVLGAFRVSETEVSLCGIIRNPESSPTLREQAVECLCAKAGRIVTDTLIEIVTGTIVVTDDGRKRAARSLGNTKTGRQLLDSQGRDRLLLHLAHVDIQDTSLPYVLRALLGHPIREGAEVIAELAMDQRCSDNIRIQATLVLMGAADTTIVEAVVNAATSGPSAELAKASVELAVRRRLPLDFQWLAGRIRTTDQRIERHGLVKLFVEAMAYAKGSRFTQAASLFHSMFSEAFQEAETVADDLAKAISAALPHANESYSRSIPTSVWDLVKGAFAAFERDPQGSSEGHLLLAVATVDHFRDVLAAAHLKRALDASLTIKEVDGSNSFRRNRLASAICECLTRLAPEFLLSYPIDCDPVRLSLKKMSLERNCLVYCEHILDDEGLVIAQLPAGTTESEQLEAAGDSESAISSGIRLGERPAEAIRLLRVFYFIGLEFSRGATSMNDVAKKFEFRDDGLPGSKAGISKACRELQAWFDLHDNSTKPLFKQARIGLPISGLTERGLAAWEQTNRFLLEQNVIK